MDEQAQLLMIFREEAEELTDKIAEGLEAIPQLGAGERAQRLAIVLRHAHNLKGAAAMVGASQVERVAHAVESALTTSGRDELRDDSLYSTLQRAIALARLAAYGEVDPSALASVLDALGAQPEPARPMDEVIYLEEKPAPAAWDVDRVEHAPGVRVERARLDRLMGFTGELLIAGVRRTLHSQELTMLLRDAQRAVWEHDSDPRTQLHAFARRLQHIVKRGRDDLVAFGHLTSELQHAMQTVRMMPLKSLEPLVRRVVRESAQQCEKLVQLELDFGSIEVDKEVLDALRDPLMHLLRNAVDHGIESAETRTSAGKSNPGTIKLAASALGTVVTLAIEDDGRGFDFDRIRAKAVALGIYSEAEAASLDRRTLAELVFRSGFSTAAVVTHQSGRGVGLDVVRSRLTRFGGNVTWQSSSAVAGTRFLLTVPTNVLSTLGFLVRVETTTYALPMASVMSAARVRKDALRRVDDCDVITLADGQVVRFEPLDRLLGVANDEAPEKLVVVAREGRQLALGVNEIIGEREFVTLPLPWMLEGLPGVDGAIILEDGALALSLDIASLFLTERSRSPTTSGTPRATAPHRKRILLVDDSPQARSLEHRQLASAGYDVTLAVDGSDALNQLERGRFDLVVSDVNMPAPDGLELTRRLRAHSRYRDVPVVLVTACATAEDRAAGMAAGADAYLVKGSFGPRALLDAVSRYL